MATVDTLVLIGVVCGSVWCFRKAFIKFLNWINKSSSSGEDVDDDTTTGVNFE